MHFEASKMMIFIREIVLEGVKTQKNRLRRATSSKVSKNTIYKMLGYKKTMGPVYSRFVGNFKDGPVYSRDYILVPGKRGGYIPPIPPR